MSYSSDPCCTTFLLVSLVCGLFCDILKELSLNVNSWDRSFYLRKKSENIGDEFLSSKLPLLEISRQNIPMTKIYNIFLAW